MEQREIIEFLNKEIKNCDEEINNAGNTIEASLGVQKYYVRRREYLRKLKDLQEL